MSVVGRIATMLAPARGTSWHRNVAVSDSPGPGKIILTMLCPVHGNSGPFLNFAQA